MLDIGERLSSYEPLWENWYKDSYIGGGNFGKVYKLKQNFFGEIRYSAVKIIPIILTDELNSLKGNKEAFIENKKTSMVQEIKNMYKLKGQNHLVQCLAHSIKDIFDDNGTIIGFDVLIQMDIYSSLTQYMRNNGELSIEQVEKLAIDIASGLSSMHSINMLHRDIKIDNVYVDQKGNFLLGDFGISKQEALSSYSTLAGTQPFIAPEVWKVQHTKRRYTKTADIYSYGILLYYLLNGSMLPLVTENSTQNDIDNAVYDRLNGKLFGFPKNGPEKLKRIVMKCCAYRPEDRFQSINEVLQALHDENYQVTQDPYATIYAGDESMPSADSFQPSNTPQYDSMQPDYGTPYSYPYQHQELTAKNNNVKKIITLLIFMIAILLATIVVIAVLFLLKQNNDNSSTNLDENKINSTINAVSENTDTIKTTTMTTTTTTTTTTTKTTSTSKTAKTTTAAPTDAEINGYDEFDTKLVVRVDEADTLPLRSQPNKETSEILKRIPDGTTVHILGYKDTGSEIWFRVEYDSTQGWCRGGMLQPYDLDMLYDTLYNKPGLEKWKVKFQLQVPNDASYEGSADFEGTLYFLPDLSSGVQRRFKSYTTVDIYAKQGDWYFVEVYSDEYYNGWVYKSQLSF